LYRFNHALIKLFNGKKAIAHPPAYPCIFILRHWMAQQAPPAKDTIITDTVTKEVLIPLRQRVADEIKKNIEQFNAD
jgi:hypothetical protein